MWVFMGGNGGEGGVCVCGGGGGEVVMGSVVLVLIQLIWFNHTTFWCLVINL